MLKGWGSDCDKQSGSAAPARTIRPRLTMDYRRCFDVDFIKRWSDADDFKIDFILSEFCYSRTPPLYPQRDYTGLQFLAVDEISLISSDMAICAAVKGETRNTAVKRETTNIHL
ncbi:unnamed protein product [Lactuca virosa]|uniref:Uncharacterized protein n=1 Tax=Lactuca virosa TaxID=75947 RepID=A0AAU9NVG9_9ASTR|nr:unnamed protein product [Lactuca virosa]